MKKCIVTIFIHGTLPPAPFFKLSLLKQFFWCPKGLNRFIDRKEKFHLASLAELLCSEDPDLFDKDFFYLFGWSGHLSVQERRKAARELAEALRALMQQLAQKALPVFLRIITHSHGGNVALHLAEVCTNKEFTVDQLILLACPVQKETASSISSPLFSSIISVHSHLDVIQRIDPQGIHNFLKSLQTHGLEFTVTHARYLGPLFSSRHFRSAKRLLQVHVKYPSRELLHIEFILPDYARSLPAFLRHIEDLPSQQNNQELLYIISPVPR